MSSSQVLSSTASSHSPAATGMGGGSSSLSLANSASLYLYTFLATLVLLLSVSGAIVVRSFVLRRRHRLMVEEAIRNGTWVPPAPPTRSPRIDLSKKPTLWEAHLGGGGWQGGEIEGLNGKDLGIGTNWTVENWKDWESIRPISVDYVPSGTPSASAASHRITPPVLISVPTPISPSTSNGDEENQQTAEPSTTAAPSLFTRVTSFLNPTPQPTSPLPASSTPTTNLNNRNSPSNVPMTELRSSSPSAVRVTVLIAMPSPPSYHGSSTALSSFSSSLSNSNVPTSACPLRTDDEDQLLPQLEMGIVEIPLGPSQDSTGWDTTRRREVKTSYSRGSSYAEP